MLKSDRSGSWNTGLVFSAFADWIRTVRRVTCEARSWGDHKCSVRSDSVIAGERVLQRGHCLVLFFFTTLRSCPSTRSRLFIGRFSAWDISL
jgi:hypothetical protein